MENTITPQLTSYEDVVTTINQLSMDTSAMYRHVLKAQLAVLDYVQKPFLVNVCIDTVLENLHYSMEMAMTDAEVKLVRRQAALVIQSLLFTVHATLLQKNKETREEGIKLLKMATENIASFSADIALAVATTGGSKKAAAIRTGMNAVAAFLNKKSLESEQGQQKKGFLTRIVDYFASTFENEEEEKQYYALLDSVFEKIARNKGLLGKSVILSELVRNHRDEIIDYSLEDEYNRLSIMRDEYLSIETPFFKTWYLLMYPLILAVLLVTWLIDAFADSSYVESTYMFYWLLFPLPIFLFKVVRNYFDKRSWKKAILECEERIEQQQEALMKKYEDIADALYPVY